MGQRLAIQQIMAWHVVAAPEDALWANRGRRRPARRAAPSPPTWLGATPPLPLATSLRWQGYADDHHLPLSATVSDVLDLDEVGAWATGDDPPDPILLLHVWNVSWGVATGTGVSSAHMAIARGMPFFS